MRKCGCAKVKALAPEKYKEFVQGVAEVTSKDNMKFFLICIRTEFRFEGYKSSTILVSESSNLVSDRVHLFPSRVKILY